ncbi:MAG: polysaccharide deacetylase family protein [Candidatus Omnitrophica bacterium]|nr:polysaccharide deacetylase family protein [Candidatus Omnitrophota bacterium]
MLKRKRLNVSLLIAAVLFISLAVFMRSQYVVPILMYHSVCENPVEGNRLAVSTDTFRRQMHFLKRHNYNILTLEQLADLIKNKKKIPPRAVAITLDDGYRDNFDCAFPVLKEYGIPATLFLIVDEIGRPQKDRLFWEEIFKMRDSGVIVFGSHCLGPDPLTKIKTDDGLRRQIFDSKRILEEKLGRPVDVFSYPEGRFNDKIRKMVIEAGYKTAVVTNPGKEFANDDIFALKRLRISENARNMFVFWVESSGYYNFMREHRHK